MTPISYKLCRSYSGPERWCGCGDQQNRLCDCTHIGIFWCVPSDTASSFQSVIANVWCSANVKQKGQMSCGKISSIVLNLRVKAAQSHSCLSIFKSAVLTRKSIFDTKCFLLRLSSKYSSLPLAIYPKDECTLCPQKLALTSPTSGCRSVDVVLSRPQSKKFLVSNRGDSLFPVRYEL
jgi:hypothetical protein